ncbi:hypothetical protein ASE00_18925 [Sphingomonas sp. Root710]|uniref:TadE/TadG family type IV pilus assembly protein n=1 Tax=Sphingomonas sp. Root710 TaxID=1736594 RepID=UPI0006FB6CDB|nr:TadE/TadG family type IV pilus assembly protein [Sphingomonas sp. Root710]KRB79784.1 hypothetical protein ASE00_18925 [Sphingomonas sp. Root710]
MIRAWIHSIAAVSRRLADSTRGGVALIGALSLTTIVGMGAFAVEATRGYAADTQNQRIADMAALAGALAYNVNSNTTEMTATAKAVVVAQGLAASAATVQLVTDSATSKQLVQVTVTTSVPLALGRVFTSALSYDVSAVGSATTTSTTTSAPPCIAALSSTPTYGITLSGGVAINSPGCAINTNAGVTVPWGTTISAKQVNAGKTVNNPGSGITTSPTANNIVQNKTSAASDWMASDSNLQALLCKVNKLSGYSDPDYPGGNTACTTALVTPVTATGFSDLTLDYSPSGTLATYFNSGAKTYTIPAGAYNNIKTLTISGGLTVYFQGPADRAINTISMGGTALHFGSGNVSIAGKIDVNGGALVDFDVGVGNTITFGNVSGTSINVGGGAKVCFTVNCVAPTVAAGTFSVSGDIITSGGSTIVFPKAATHVINGNLSLNGSSIFGSGSYIIKGYFSNNTGGTMSGTDVTFALGGTFTLSGGTSLDLAAPSASSSYGIPGVLVATKTSSATAIGGGSANKYAGLFYAPKSDLTLSGGASMSSNGTNCLMMILNTLTLSGGTNVASACSSLSGSSSTTANVALFK